MEEGQDQSKQDIMDNETKISIITIDQNQTQQQSENDFNLRVNYSSLEQDMELAEAVAKHSCLYDRRHPKYRRINDPTNEAWEEVAKSVPHVANGETACRLFEVLKKRYSKKKMNFKRATHYSNSQEFIKKTQYELEKYQFLSWLEPFIRYRTVKLDTNDATELDDIEEIGDESLSASDNQTKSLKSVENPQKRKHFDDENSYSVASSVPKMTHLDNSQLPSYAYPRQVIPPMHVNLASPTSSTTLNISTDQSGSMLYQNKVLSDEDDLFAAMVMTQLKSLNKREKCIAKQEISNVLFKAQLKQMDEK